MNVLFIPHSQNNPYQELLVAALSKHDVHVRLVNEFQRFPLLSAIHQAGKPDLIHLHWTSAFWHHQVWNTTLLALIRFLVELLVIKVRGIKIVWTVHNLQSHDSAKSHFEYQANRLFCRFYNHIIVHCLKAQNAVLQTYRLPYHFQKKMSVINHGHYIGHYENHMSQNQARKQLKLSSKDNVFLFFGRVHPYKGVFQLVDAFEEQNTPHTHLFVVGQPADAPLREELEVRCERSKNISLHLRHIPDIDIQLYMQAANVVVLPFREILTSGTVMLAMSFGKAIIAPRLGCITEILDERGCIFYDFEDPRGLEKALLQAPFFDMPAMGEHNLSLAQTYSWEKIGRETYRVYLRCLST